MCPADTAARVWVDKVTGHCDAWVNECFVPEPPGLAHGPAPKPPADAGERERIKAATSAAYEALTGCPPLPAGDLFRSSPVRALDGTGWVVYVVRLWITVAPVTVDERTGGCSVGFLPDPGPWTAGRW